MEPAEVLRRADTHEVELATPTWMTLTALARFNAIADFLADARGRPPLRFATRLGHAETGPVAIWDGDAAYIDGDLDRPGARHRLYMGRGVWRYDSVCSETRA